MPKLMCDVKTCHFHKQDYCTKDRIKVCNCFENDNHETMCDSYKQKKNEKLDDYDTEFGELGQINEYLSVSCNVLDCIHNQHEICKATNIKIDGNDAKSKNGTICSSYASKL